MNVLVSESNNISLRQNSVSTCVNACVGFIVFWQIDLSLVVNPEVGKFCLRAHSHLSSDVSHLQCLTSKFPLIPVVVWLDVLVNEMGWSCHTFVNHEGC